MVSSSLAQIRLKTRQLQDMALPGLGFQPCKFGQNLNETQLYQFPVGRFQVAEVPASGIHVSIRNPKGVRAKSLFSEHNFVPMVSFSQ